MTRCQKSCGRSSLEFCDGRCRVLWTGIKTGFPGARLWTEHLPSIGPRWTGSNSLRRIVLSGEKARQSRPLSSTPAIRRGARSRETAFRSALLNFMGSSKSAARAGKPPPTTSTWGSPSVITALPSLMWAVAPLQSDLSWRVMDAARCYRTIFLFRRGQVARRFPREAPLTSTLACF